MTTPASGRVRVGIVGLSADGGWAALAHEPAIRAHPAFELVGVVGSSHSSARRAAEKYSLDHYFEDAADMAASDHIDLVVVAVKVPSHREPALAALAANKPVLCEWPLAKSSAEADELASAAVGRDSFVMLQGRTTPAMAHVRELVTHGYVGTVLSTTMLASGMAWGRQTEERNIYLHDRSNGATMQSIPFGHALDTLTSVLGQPSAMTAVTARRRERIAIVGSDATIPLLADDQVAVIGTLDSGAVVSIHYRGGISRATNFAWEINGTEGDLRLTSDNGHLQYGSITIQGAHGTERMHDLDIPARLDLFPELTGTRAHAIAHAYDNVAGAFSGGVSQTPDFADAAALHHLLDRIEQSEQR